MVTPKEKIEKIRKAFQRNCHFCRFHIASSHDYEWGYLEPAYCTKPWKEFVSNLKSFPFLKEQKCFEADTEYFDWTDEDLIDLKYKYGFSTTDEEREEISNKIKVIINQRYWDLISPSRA